jgi:hypothetical protein
VDDGVPALHAALAVAVDRPGERDRRGSDALDGEPHLDLVVEAEHGEVVGLDAPPRVVAPVVQQTQATTQRGLRRLGVTEDAGEVDAAARVRVGPRDAAALAVLDGDGPRLPARGGLAAPRRRGCRNDTAPCET